MGESGWEPFTTSRSLTIASGTTVTPRESTQCARRRIRPAPGASSVLSNPLQTRTTFLRPQRKRLRRARPRETSVPTHPPPTQPDPPIENRKPSLGADVCADYGSAIALNGVPLAGPDPVSKLTSQKNPAPLDWCKPAEPLLAPTWA
jgi:hypothetical protein